MRLLSVLVGIGGLLAGIGVANAHTTSLGFVPAGTAGSVTFWTGSYDHSATPVNEGTATLTGVSVVYNQVVNFNIPPVNVKPAGLVDGTNNFYWPSTGPFPVNTDPLIGGGVVWWQGVTFTGLTPGTYTFTCGGTCGVTAQWASWDATGSVTVNLTGVITGGGGPADIPTVSEWGLIIMALLLSAAGILALRLRPR